MTCPILLHRDLISLKCPGRVWEVQIENSHAKANQSFTGRLKTSGIQKTKQDPHQLFGLMLFATYPHPTDYGPVTRLSVRRVWISQLVSRKASLARETLPDGTR